MYMLLLIGVSVGFALSVLTSNNFYAEKTFTSSVNQVVCNEMKSEGCKDLIAQVSVLSQNGWQSYYGSGGGSGNLGNQSRDLVDVVENFFNSIFNAVSDFFRNLF